MSVALKIRESVQRNYEHAMVFLGSRSTAYRLVFGTGNGNREVPISAKQFVLDDLKKFCRANRTTFDPDQRMSDILIGRREVFLRIVQNLKMDPEQLYAIANALPIQTTVGDEDVNT